MNARWLLRTPGSTAAARLFCFPYSGVGGSMFNKWPREFDGIEVCPVQLLGRENRSREAHYGTYERLAAAVAEAIAGYLDRPFLFFGHCAGALPAFETARRLAELGLPVPQRLVVSAQVAPHDCPHDRFLDCTDEELREELANLARLRGGQPHPVLLDLALEVLHRDLDANRAYRRNEPLVIPSAITVLHWAGDVEVSESQLAGWDGYSNDTRFVVLDGGHYDFLSAPPGLLGELARGVSEAMPD